MTGATTQGGTLQLVATARVSTATAFNQHQMKADPARGNTRRGMDRLTPAVVNDDMRDWMASRHAGFLSIVFLTSLTNWRGLNCAPSFSRNSHWSRLSSPGVRTSRGVSRSASALPHRKRVCLRTGQTRAYSLRLADCSPLLRDTLPVKQLSQSLAYRNHHQTLSSSLVSAGFNTSEATDGRVPNTAGAFQKTEGELPNVGS